jgi:excinuclease ABC subunit C
MGEIVSQLLEEQLGQLPHSPGVYLLRDAEGTILYVGKASDLRHRVRSHFTGGQKLTPKLPPPLQRPPEGR